MEAKSSYSDWCPRCTTSSSNFSPSLNSSSLSFTKPWTSGASTATAFLSLVLPVDTKALRSNVSRSTPSSSWVASWFSRGGGGALVLIAPLVSCMAFLLGNSGLRRRHALRKPRLGDKCVTELPVESSVTVFYRIC